MPGRPNWYRTFQARAKNAVANAQTPSSSATSPSQTATPATSQANDASGKKRKRARKGCTAEELAKEKRRRVDDPEPSQETDEDSIEEAIESSPVQPKNPGWVLQAWNCNASADDEARRALGIEQMYDAARQIGRCSTEYPDQVRALTYGVIFRGFEPEDRPDYQIGYYSEDVEARLVYLVWAAYFPELEDHLDYLAMNPALILHLGQYVNTIAGKVRSDDLGRLNANIISYSNLDDPNNILKRHSNRGFEDSRTGRLLCPVRYLDDFEAEPARVCSIFRNHLRKLFSYDFPSFMTDLSMMDPEDRETGFLRGPLLVTYYKAIFCGRSSVYGEVSTRGQQSVAVKYNMGEVNLHSIIYVALLARSALGSDAVWSDGDGKHWRARLFVHAVMDLAYKSPSWSQATIAWWNKQIFGIDEDDNDSETERELQDSDYYKILAQRAARNTSATTVTSAPEPALQERQEIEEPSAT